jgi:hypothetical protein
MFTIMIVLHLILHRSSVLSWVLFLADLGLMGWLTLNAYRDADTLDRYACRLFLNTAFVVHYEISKPFLTTYYRYEIPYIGPIASRIVDDE